MMSEIEYNSGVKEYRDFMNSWFSRLEKKIAENRLLTQELRQNINQLFDENQVNLDNKKEA